MGGLSLSLRLAKLGFSVDVYEQNNSIGGKANILEENGFRFDTGPSLITMPFVLEDLFKEVSLKVDNDLKFNKLDLLCKYFFPDKTVINAYSNQNKFSAEIENKTEDSIVRTDKKVFVGLNENRPPRPSHARVNHCQMNGSGREIRG